MNKGKGLKRVGRRGDNIHRRKDGRWEGRYKNGYKPDGSSKYSSVYASSYADCKRKLIDAQSQAVNSISSRRNTKCFSDVLSAWMYANRVRIKGATKAKYLQIIEKHIIPALGGIKIHALNANEINDFLGSKLKSGGLKNHEALSASYVRTMAVIIEAAVNYSVMEGMRDPLKTPIHKPSIPKKDVIVLSKSLETVLTQKMSAASSQTALGVLLALQCGLRIGEVCALKWSDVDFETGIVRVRHTISRVPCTNSEQKTMLILDTPKTTSSIRDVPIPTSLQNILFKAYKKTSSEFIVSQDHTFVGTRTFDYQYRRLLKRHNIEIFNFHALRHTYATRCAETGMDAKTLSQLLGHSSSNISLNVYVHPSMEVAMDHIERIFASS